MMRKSVILISSLILLPLAFLMSCASLSSKNPCTVKNLKYGPEDFQVNVTSYINHISDSKSLLIMPPTGGTSSVDRSYAKKFCAAGFDVYILNSWSGDNEKSDDLDLHQHLYAKGQKAIEIVLKEIKTPFIGLMGTSVGALYASVAAATTERINAVFLIAAGAPLMEVTVKSDQKAMRDLKISRKARFGFADDDGYLKALQQNFKLEPMEQGPLHQTKKYGMVVAELDETVPTKNQNQLKEFLKPGKVISMPHSHLVAIVNTWVYHQQEVIDFFKELAPP